MTESNPYPQVMANAREDLAGNIAGDFSPHDWEAILARAAQQLRDSGKEPGEAWIDVIRAFHRERYWGFVPDYIKPKRTKPKPEEQNLGIRFIWYSFRSFLITKVVILYFGARYTIDQGPVYGWIFFGAIAFMVVNYGLFIWRFHRREEDGSRGAESERSEV